MKATSQSTADGALLKPDTVMTMLGYTDRASFFVAVRRDGIPFIRQNARRILFEAAAVQSWINSRRVGRAS